MYTTLKPKLSAQERRCITLRYTTSLQTMPLPLRNAPSKSSPAFPVLHFPALQNGPPFSVLPFKSLSCTVRTMTRVICGAIVASHGCRLSFCSGLTTVTQGWPVSGRQLSTSPTRGDVHPLKLFWHPQQRLPLEMLRVLTRTLIGSMLSPAIRGYCISLSYYSGFESSATTPPL